MIDNPYCDLPWNYCDFLDVIGECSIYLLLPGRPRNIGGPVWPVRI